MKRIMAAVTIALSGCACLTRPAPDPHPELFDLVPFMMPPLSNLATPPIPYAPCVVCVDAPTIPDLAPQAPKQADPSEVRA